MVEHGRLPFEAEDRSVGIGLAQKHAGVVHEVASRKVVSAVHDHVVVGNDLQGVLAGQGRAEFLDDKLWVDVPHRLGGRVDLGAADVLCPVNHLALEVALVNDIEIYDADAADARRRQVEAEGCAEPTCTDH